jgi:prepilin signal peptidase PulO-like enzyme (type II secretory pathway)
LAACWMWLSPPHRLGFWLGFILIVYFAVVAVIDLEYQVVQHPVSLFGAVLGAAVGIWLHGWWVTLLGGAAGFGMMLLLYFAGEGFRRLVSKLRKQEVTEVALGFGDVNLNGVLGLIMGWPGIAGGLFLAVMIAGVFSVGYILVNLILHKYHPLQAIPYAPFLMAGAVSLLYFT